MTKKAVFVRRGRDFFQSLLTNNEFCFILVSGKNDMIKCAIVEDDAAQAEALKSHIKKFGEEGGDVFEIRAFSNAVNFLENYTADYDLAFIDIRMPYINGIQAARMLREKDDRIMIIFVTSLAQYAIEGYSVGATDYLLKPVSYADFSLTMTRAMRSLGKKEGVLFISAKEGNVCLKISGIIYIETQGHNLIYHTADKEYMRYAPLKTAVKELEGKGFSLCNRCYLVNLSYVRGIKDFTVTVGDTELQISQPRKKQFLQEMKKFTGN